MIAELALRLRPPLETKGRGTGAGMAFLRNHAEAIAAIDLCVVPTLTFECLFAFLVVATDGGSCCGSGGRPRSRA
jgi:hypothetical protein